MTDRSVQHRFSAMHRCFAACFLSERLLLLLTLPKVDSVKTVAFLTKSHVLQGVGDVLKARKDIMPILTFLEMKAAYDTVNRNRVWSAVQYPASPPFLALLTKALFDDIHIEALLSHVVSCQFSPRTDVS